MSQKIIRLTESDLNRIVKKVLREGKNWWEQPLVTDQVKKIKPSPGGKYCFSRKKISEIVALNDRSYVVYKIVPGDSSSKLLQYGNVIESNDLCDLKNNVRAGDVIIYSLRPSGDLGK